MTLGCVKLTAKPNQDKYDTQLLSVKWKQWETLTIEDCDGDREENLKQKPTHDNGLGCVAFFFR